jgi:hypothetical protein
MKDFTVCPGQDRTTDKPLWPRPSKPADRINLHSADKKTSGLDIAADRQEGRSVFFAREPCMTYSFIGIARPTLEGCFQASACTCITTGMMPTSGSWEPGSKRGSRLPFRCG